MIRHGESGVLCPVRDEPATVRLIVRLLKDAGRWETISRRSACEARERFSIDNVVPLYEELYEKARSEQ